jgi:hypothetical protein
MIIVLGTIILIIIACFVYQVLNGEAFECKVCYNWKREWADTKHRKYKSTVTYSLWFCAAAFVIFGATWSGSYGSYLDCKSFYTSTVEQYASAIEIYGDKAVIDIEAVALTDFKYKGYQENISKFVVDLRNRIVDYNEIMVAKMTMDKNPLFSWLVIAPDKDMKLITMKTALKG